MSEDSGAVPDASGFGIRPMEAGDVRPVLLALTNAFGQGFDREWFDWKHRDGPWGPSLGWIAQDDAGLVGVRLFLRWRLQDGEHNYNALRPCDTVTVPRARGRGVFRALTEHAISSLDENADLLFNTPNANSKPGYLKMGFVEWGTVRQRVFLVLPRRVGLTDSPVLPAHQGAGVRTMLEQVFLSWRYERCPSRDYRWFGLDDDESNGIVCRLRTWRRLNLMVVTELWGQSEARSLLVQGAAHELGARLAWLAEPCPGVGPFSVSRPGTSVTRYDVRGRQPGALALSLGDVEDVL